VAHPWSDSLSILRNLSGVPANEPPGTFSLVSPAEEDTIFGPITFRWQASYDANFGDQIRYDLYLSTDSGFHPDYTTIYDSLSITRLIALLRTDTYYWKVKAYDNWGAEKSSNQTWGFYDPLTRRC